VRIGVGLVATATAGWGGRESSAPQANGGDLSPDAGCAIDEGWDSSAAGWAALLAAEVRRKTGSVSALGVHCQPPRRGGLTWRPRRGDR